MKKLSFIIAKFLKYCATSFYHYLNAHPESFMSAQKEVERLETFNINTYKWRGY